MGDGKQKVALLQLGPKFHLPRGAKPTVGAQWLGMFPNCGNGSWQSIVDHVSVVIRIFTGPDSGSVGSPVHLNPGVNKEISRNQFEGDLD